MGFFRLHRHDLDDDDESMYIFGNDEVMMMSTNLYDNNIAKLYLTKIELPKPLAFSAPSRKTWVVQP